MELKCPKCSSLNVIFSKKKQIQRCEDCDHEFVSDKKITPLRIFISYGRDEYVQLAKRLKEDLQKRGHEVWFDADKLKEGGDWEQYIEEGISYVAKDINKGRMAFIMTPHSTRRPDGYCLNELALAIKRSLPIVPIMLVYTEPPLSICRIQYLDMQDSFPPDEKTVTYEQRFERLILALEENKLDYEGLQSKLLSALEPIKFHADIYKLLTNFTGRKWVIEKIDKWIANPEGSKIFWIVGAPGTGKSAISAWIQENRREIAAYHFCDINSEEKRDTRKLVKSIAYQLSTQLPQYEERLKFLQIHDIVNTYQEAYTLFDKLIVQPITDKFSYPGRTIVLLIDALDEATYKGNNDIARLISRCADKTPSWLRVLVTSRPEQEITTELQSLSPFILDTSTDDNLMDIREYLKNHLPEMISEQTEEIVNISEGLFLYVKYVCEEIKAGRLSLDRIDEFPQGLGGIYKQFFDNRFSNEQIAYYKKEVRPLLCAVLASFEPLTLGHLMRLLNKKNLMEVFDITDTLGSLFPRGGDAEDGAIKPFHRSIKDWIIDKSRSGIYFIDEQYGHKMLADYGWMQYKSGVEKMEDYYLEWLPNHLVEIKDYEKVIEALKDFDLIMARLKAGHLDKLLEDYKEIIKKIPPDEANNLMIYCAFFRERGHILRRGNDKWPAHKILLQLAIEHADDSPLTQSAEQFLAAGKVDWVWLRREQRQKNVYIDLCVGVLEGHTDGVFGAIELKDGRILSWSPDKTLILWSSDGKIIGVLKGHTDGVIGAIELKDSRILSWSMDNTLRLWNNDGKEITILKGHTSKIIGAKELKDGRILSWSNDGTLRLWSKDGKEINIAKHHTLNKHQKEITINGNIFSELRVIELNDGRILSWISHWTHDCTLRLWSSEGKDIAILKGHTGHVNGAIELKDGRILSWSNDGTLLLWNNNGKGIALIYFIAPLPFLRNNDCKSIAILKGHTSKIFGAKELKDGRILSWSSDGTLRLWSNNGKGIAILKGHTGAVKGAKELKDGKMLSWAMDNTLRLWSNDGKAIATLKGHTSDIFGAKELKDGKMLSWAGDNTLRLWSNDGKEIDRFLGHSGLANGAIELKDGRILSWARDNTLCLWSNNGKEIDRFLGHSGLVNGAIELKDGRILSWAYDNTFRLWSNDGKEIAILDGHTSCTSYAFLSHNTNLKVSWYGNGNFQLSDKYGTEIGIISDFTSWVNGAIELKDGRILSWAWDNTLRLWSNRGKEITVLQGHSDWVKEAIELKDGRILSWAWDNNLRLWSSDGKEIAVLEGHTDLVNGAIELKDGRILSWANDNTLRLWSSDGKEIAVLEGHKGWVNGAIEWKDGRILSWAWDNNLRLWSSDGKEIAVLEGHKGWVNGAIEWKDSRILSWANDSTLRVWSSEGKELSCYEQSEGFSLYPEAAETLLGKGVISGDAWIVSKGGYAWVCKQGFTLKNSIFWHSVSDCKALILRSDGTAIVTNPNEQVCFLKLYQGNRRITLSEL